MISALPSWWFTKTGKTQRRSVTLDSGGGPVITYADNLDDIAFRLNAHGGGELGTEKMNTTGNYTIYANQRPDIVATDRVVIDSRVFDVLNVNDADSAGVYLKLDAREVLPSGVGA